MSHDSHPNHLIAAVTDAIQNFTLNTGAMPVGATLSDLRDAIEQLDVAVGDIRRAAVIFPNNPIDLEPRTSPVTPRTDPLKFMMLPEEIPLRVRITPRPYEDNRHIMTVMAGLNGQRCTASWNGTEGVVDLSVQLASVVQLIDPFGEDR